MKFLNWQRILVAFAVMLLVGSAKPTYQYLHPRLAPEDFVTTSVTYNPALCGDDKPIRIEIVNHSFKQINSVDIWLSVKEPGRSTNIIAGNDPLRNDYIVKPKEALYLCWWLYVIGKANPTNAARQYSIEKSKVIFQ